MKSQYIIQPKLYGNRVYFYVLKEYVLFWGLKFSSYASGGFNKLEDAEAWIRDLVQAEDYIAKWSCK